MNALRKKDLLTLVACAVLFAVMQGLMMAEIIGPFWELNIVLICINIILSVSLNLINGYTGQFSIGHAGFLAVGAYTGAIVTVKLGFSYELALIAGTVAAGFLGFLIGLPTLRLNGDYLAIATLGLGEIIRICILNIDYVGGASGLMGIPRLTNFPWVFWIMIFIIFFIKISRIQRQDAVVWQFARMRSLLILWVSTLRNTKLWRLRWGLLLPALQAYCSRITFILHIRHPLLSCVLSIF